LIHLEFLRKEEANRKIKIIKNWFFRIWCIWWKYDVKYKKSYLLL